MSGNPPCAKCGREITNKGQIAYVGGNVPDWLHVTRPEEVVIAFDHEATPRLPDTQTGSSE